jgi:hypothetical protein
MNEHGGDGSIDWYDGIVVTALGALWRIRPWWRRGGAIRGWSPARSRWIKWRIDARIALVSGRWCSSLFLAFSPPFLYSRLSVDNVFDYKHVRAKLECFIDIFRFYLYMCLHPFEGCHVRGDVKPTNRALWWCRWQLITSPKSVEEITSLTLIDNCSSIWIWICIWTFQFITISKSRLL